MLTRAIFVSQLTHSSNYMFTTVHALSLALTQYQYQLVWMYNIQSVVSVDLYSSSTTQMVFMDISF